MLYLLIHGEQSHELPTLEEITQWQAEHLGALEIAGGPSTPSWKRYSADPVSISLPLSVIIDPTDMAIKFHGSRLDETVLDELIRQ